VVGAGGRAVHARYPIDACGLPMADDVGDALNRLAATGTSTERLSRLDTSPLV